MIATSAPAPQEPTWEQRLKGYTCESIKNPNGEGRVLTQRAKDIQMLLEDREDIRVERQKAIARRNFFSDQSAAKQRTIVQLRKERAEAEQKEDQERVKRRGAEARLRRLLYAIEEVYDGQLPPEEGWERIKAAARSVGGLDR